METAPERLEVATQLPTIEACRAGKDADVRQRPIAYASQVVRRDRLEIKKPATHRSDVPDRAAARDVGEVRENPLANHEVELPPRAPLGDVSLLVTVSSASVRTDVDRFVARIRHV